MSTLAVLWAVGLVPLLIVLAVPAWLALAAMVARVLGAWRRRA